MTLYEQLQQKNSQISSVQSQLSSKNSQKTSLVSSIAQLVSDIATNTTTISTLQDQIVAIQQQIDDNEVNKTNLLAELSDLQSQVASLIILRDAAYAEVSDQVDLIDSQIVDLQGQIDTKYSQIGQLNSEIGDLNNDILQIQYQKDNLTNDYNSYNYNLYTWIVGLRNRTWDFNNYTTQLTEILTGLGFTSYEDYKSGINTISYQNEIESIAFGMYIFNGGYESIGNHDELGRKMSELIQINKDSNGTIISVDVKNNVTEEMVKSSFKEYLFELLFAVASTGYNFDFNQRVLESWNRSELKHIYNLGDIQSLYQSIYNNYNYYVTNIDNNDFKALMTRIMGDVNYLPKYYSIEDLKWNISNENSNIIDSQSELQLFINRRDELSGTTASVGLIADVTSQISSLTTLIDDLTNNGGDQSLIDDYTSQRGVLNNLLEDYNWELSSLLVQIDDITVEIENYQSYLQTLVNDLANLGELEDAYTLWTNFMGAYDVIYNKVRYYITEPVIIRQIAEFFDGNDVPTNNDFGVVSLLRLYKYLTVKAPVNRFNRGNWNDINYYAVPLVNYLKSCVKDTSIDKTPMEQDNDGIYEIPYGNQYILLDYNQQIDNMNLGNIRYDLHSTLYSLISNEGLDMHYSVPNGYISGN